MDKLVLFTKSYRGDLQRAINLSESIQKHNVDKLPYYVSVPKEDVEMFENALPYYTKIIADEEITNMGHGWVGQQYVKALFYKLNLCEYYVCIDSDAYFFKDFTIDDFFWDEDTPYMVMHERQCFYEFVDRYNDTIFRKHIDIRKDHEEEYRDIREFLTGDSSGKLYHYGISPYMWSTEIWKRLDTEYGIDTLFKRHANELKWYGEAVLKYKKPYMPTIPFFKEINYKQQYEFYKQLGWEEENFKKQYLGIVMQSNWGAPLKY